MGFRMSHTLVAALVVLLLAGCVPGDPLVTPEPEPDATPLFASDDEALAAATEAYAKYLKVSDAIAHDGGSDVERMQNLVTEVQYVKELNGFQQLLDQHLHFSGTSAFDNASLQSWVMLSPSTAQIVIYACSDVSSTRVLDADGHDVTPDSRPERTPLELEFTSASGDPRDLLLSRSEVWLGNDFC
jgi:hypothetical protein